MPSLCSIDGCQKIHDAHGYCATHYRRWKRHGDPHTVTEVTPKRQLIDRDGPGGCWIWLGVIDPRGYGRWSSILAHRRIYELFHGPIPEGLTLDHLCRVTRCVNPDHLEPCTASENLRRRHGRFNAVAEDLPNHCGNGHEFTPDNTYVSPRGIRQCKQCRRTIDRRRDRNRTRSRRRAEVAR